jgi:ribose transport system permease protein
MNRHLLNRSQLARFQSLLALLVMVVALSFASEQFLTVPNLRNILLQISVNLCRRSA